MKTDTTGNGRIQRNEFFTLIELLIVISIIAILASMLLPALSRAKRQALRVADMNNVRLSGLATIMYTVDNNAFFPWIDEPDRPICNYAPQNNYRDKTRNMAYCLEPYIGDFSVYRCNGLPANDVINIDEVPDLSMVSCQLSYFMARNRPAFGLDGMPWKATDPDCSSTLTMISCNARDHGGWGIWANHLGDGAVYEYSLARDRPYNFYKIYGISGVDGISAVFTDGSARWVRGSEMEIIGSFHVKVWGVMPE